MDKLVRSKLSVYGHWAVHDGTHDDIRRPVSRVSHPRSSEAKQLIWALSGLGLSLRSSIHHIDCGTLYTILLGSLITV